MGLATRTFTPKTKTHVVDRILDRLEDDDRNWLLNQLADLSVTNVWIAEQLEDEGFTCSESSVADWRRRRKAKA